MLLLMRHCLHIKADSKLTISFLNISISPLIAKESRNTATPSCGNDFLLISLNILFGHTEAQIDCLPTHTYTHTQKQKRGKKSKKTIIFIELTTARLYSQKQQQQQRNVYRTCSVYWGTKPRVCISDVDDDVALLFIRTHTERESRVFASEKGKKRHSIHPCVILCWTLSIMYTQPRERLPIPRIVNFSYVFFFFFLLLRI